MTVEFAHRSAALLPSRIDALERENRRLQGKSDLRAAILAWILANAENLVFDIEGEQPAQFHSLIASGEYDRLARYIEAALNGGALPRMICAGCHTAPCGGCNGFTTVTVPSPRVLNLLQVVRSG